MRLILNYYHKFTYKLQHSIFVLNESEFKEFQKQYGDPVNIRREYPENKPNPERITGEGWVLKNGYAKEDIFLRKNTYKQYIYGNINQSKRRAK